MQNGKIIIAAKVKMGKKNAGLPVAFWSRFGIQLMIAIAKNCCKLWHKHEEMGVILRYLIDYICGRIFSERARELFAHSPVISCLYLLLLLY